MFTDTTQNRPPAAVGVVSGAAARGAAGVLRVVCARCARIQYALRDYRSHALEWTAPPTTTTTIHSTCLFLPPSDVGEQHGTTTDEVV